MKITVLLVFYCSLCLGQKTFIGKSEKEVMRYWTKREPNSRFEHRRDTVNNTSTYTVVKNDSAEFHAEFVNGRCVSNNYKISESQSMKFNDQLKKLGYIWDESTKRWYNTKRQTQWLVESLRGGLYIMSATPVIPK